MVELAISIVSFVICLWFLIFIGAVVLSAIVGPFVGLAGLMRAMDEKADARLRRDAERYTAEWRAHAALNAQAVEQRKARRSDLERSEPLRAPFWFGRFSAKQSHRLGCL